MFERMMRLGMFNRAEPSSLLNGLVSYWKLNEVSDGSGPITRVDSKGTNNLTDVNNVVGVAGKVGWATQFASGDLLTIPSNADLQAGDIDFTFACWVYMTNKDSLRSFVSKLASGSAREYHLHYYNTANVFRFYVANGATIVGDARALTLGSPSLNTWYFIVAWHDSVNNKAYIQVDNGTPDVVDTTGVPTVDNSPFCVGGTTGTTSSMVGIIDEVGLWKRTLTDAERTALYNGGSGNSHPFDGNSPKQVTWVGDDFTIIHIPDTQYYSLSHPEIFDAQMQWISDNKAALNIQLVLHDGDVVNTGNATAEWDEADESLGILDTANIPYLVAIGNHDYDIMPINDTRPATVFNTYLPQSRFTAKSWWLGGFYNETESQNSYLLMTISGRSYLILNVEHYPRQAVVNWAKSIVAGNPSRDVIIVTHSYLYGDNTPITDGVDDYGPTGEGLVDAHDGDMLWTELISQYKNIVLLVCGHQSGDQIGRLTNWANDSTKHALLFNDQSLSEGYLRIMTVSPAAGTIAVTTYSPSADAYKTDADNQFTLTYQVR